MKTFNQRSIILTSLFFLLLAGSLFAQKPTGNHIEEVWTDMRPLYTVKATKGGGLNFAFPNGNDIDIKPTISGKLELVPSNHGEAFPNNSNIDIRPTQNGSVLVTIKESSGKDGENTEAFPNFNDIDVRPTQNGGLIITVAGDKTVEFKMNKSRQLEAFPDTANVDFKPTPMGGIRMAFPDTTGIDIRPTQNGGLEVRVAKK